MQEPYRTLQVVIFPNSRLTGCEGRFGNFSLPPPHFAFLPSSFLNSFHPLLYFLPFYSSFLSSLIFFHSHVAVFPLSSFLLSLSTPFIIFLLVSFSPHSLSIVSLSSLFLDLPNHISSFVVSLCILPSPTWCCFYLLSSLLFILLFSFYMCSFLLSIPTWTIPLPCCPLFESFLTSNHLTPPIHFSL